MLDHIGSLLGIQENNPNYSQAQEQFWICVIVGASLSIIGCSIIIFIFVILGKGKKQHSRFILNICIYDLLFSVFCMTACVVNFGHNQFFLDDHGCRQAPHFSFYMFVWFFYLSGLCWLVALGGLSFWVIMSLKPKLPLWAEVAIHIFIFLYSFFITWGPNLFTDDWIFANVGPLCVWGSPLYSTLTFVPPAALLLIFWTCTTIKLCAFRSSHEATKMKIRRTFLKTILFVFIFFFCNVPKFVAIWNVTSDPGYNGFTAIVIHVQGLFDGMAYGWNEVILPFFTNARGSSGGRGKDRQTNTRNSTTVETTRSNLPSYITNKSKTTSESAKTAEGTLTS